MAVRGSITDRPWGVTLGAIALRRQTGQLVVDSDGKRYGIAFEDGVIVGAGSPLAADAIARVALTNHFITSTQVADITRRLAAAPDRDEVEVVADTVRFSADQVLKLRHRLVAQRAARTFSLERGEFGLEARISLPVYPGVTVDHRHVVYLGVRTNLSEQRLIDDLRQLGSHFVLRPDAIDELPRFGFEAAAQPVIEALKLGTSLPELEASHRELDPRLAQAVIYALVSCSACVITPRTATPPSTARTATHTAGAARTTTASQRPAGAARTTTRPIKRAALQGLGDTTPPPHAQDAEPGPQRGKDRHRTEPDDGNTQRLDHASPSGRAVAPPDRMPTASELAAAPAVAPTSTGTAPPFATGTDTFSTRGAHSTAPPLSDARTTTSPFASRTRTVSPSAYSGPTVRDAGTNTPAATRTRGPSDPPSAARTHTKSSTPSTPRAPTAPVTARTHTTSPPAGRAQTPTPSAGRSQTPTPSAGRTQTPRPTGDTAPPEPADSLSMGRSDTEENVRFNETPTPSPLLSSAKQSAVTFGEPQPTRPSSPTLGAKPNVARTPTGDTGSFAEQRTPSGFGDQRTPPDARTPNDPRASDPALARTPTGGPTPSRVSTDNVVAADAAFKRGESAMKRDQPGEAILEFKSACDLNPQDVDYAGMLAWAKFCAAGDKPGIGADTRKTLERAVMKSHKPERARFYLGRVERMLGRDKEALRHFQEVIDLKPNHAEAASEIRAIEARLHAASKSGGLFGRKR